MDVQQRFDLREPRFKPRQNITSLDQITGEAETTVRYLLSGNAVSGTALAAGRFVIHREEPVASAIPLRHTPSTRLCARTS